MKQTYELIRTKRRTLAIHIKDCRVIVRAPKRTPVREIDRFVASKSNWIEKHLAEQKARAEQRERFSLGYGSTVLYMGQKYRIATDYESEDALYFPPSLSESQIQKKLITFYKKKAEEIIPERVEYFARLIGKKPTEIRIGYAKKSWGSCTACGRLTFSWRLMMASPGAIDYVVVHELAHLKHLNHSKAFWSIVERVLPDYKERRKELHQLQKTIPF